LLIFSKISHIRKFLAQQTEKGLKIGFVPTMGALHLGHISLINKANEENDVSVCSIFVNPTQFNNPEDLKKYPRLIEKDILLLQQNKCTVLFCPEVDEMYAPNETLLVVDLKGVDKRLEGEHRPGHFQGVATIVKKLFDAVQPHKAYFGQKDFQQVQVVKTMVAQLGMRLEIIAVPTLREENGLAMSSRNMRLTEKEKQDAAIIYKALLFAKENLAKLPPAKITAQAIEMITGTEGTVVEYFELADAQTLEPVISYNNKQKVVALTAVNFGAVRLIDNLELN
jgi:pantoate--beta-alanine ligase